MLPKLEYPTYNTKLHDGTEVSFRPLLLKEYKILLMMKNADNKETIKLIKELINACTFEKLDVNKLPHFDLIFLFLKIRSKSIGEIVNVFVNCTCGNKIESSFNLEDAEVKQTENHTNKLFFDETRGMTMRYPNIDEALSMMEDSTGFHEIIKSCIEMIFDKDNVWMKDDIDDKELDEWLTTFSKQQIDVVEKFFETSPNVVQSIDVKCEKCNSNINSKITGLHNFFV